MFFTYRELVRCLSSKYVTLSCVYLSCRTSQRLLMEDSTKSCMNSTLRLDPTLTCILLQVNFTKAYTRCKSINFISLLMSISWCLYVYNKRVHIVYIMLGKICKMVLSFITKRSDTVFSPYRQINFNILLEITRN